MQKISIIIPIYNAQKYLDECLKSVQSQTYKKLEVLLIDDGSKDDSAKICKKYCDIDNRYCYIKQDNAGVSSVRNRGIDLATGEYITFVDADDVISPQYIEQLLVMMQENVDIAAVGYTTQSTEEFNCIGKDHMQIIDAETARQKMFTLNERVIDGYVWAKMYRAKLIKGKVRFDERIKFWEDMLFVIDALRMTNKCAYVNTALYYYRQNPSSAIYNRSSESFLSQMDATEAVMKEENEGSELFIMARDAYYESARRYVEYLSKEGKLLRKIKWEWFYKQVLFFIEHRKTIPQIKRMVATAIQKAC